MYVPVSGVRLGRLVGFEAIKIRCCLEEGGGERVERETGELRKLREQTTVTWQRRCDLCGRLEYLFGGIAALLRGAPSP